MIAITRCRTRYRWTCCACDTSSQAVYPDANAARRAGDRHTDTTHRSKQ